MVVPLLYGCNGVCLYRSRVPGHAVPEKERPQTEKVGAGCAEKPYFLREGSGIICGIELRGHFPYLPEMSSSLPDEAFLSRMCHEELWRLFPIILSGSREEWAELYRRERDLLAEAVGCTRITRISHIGSTAVPGLDAKPTIDILMEVSPDSFVFETPPLLRKCGYMETHRDEERMGLVMVKGYTAEGFRGQAFHLHVRPWRDWDELYFRDYLAAHPKEAQKYAELKRSLKEKFEFNRDAYTEGKTKIITAMTRRAREEMPGRYVP